jgi:DNA-binding response OmpR family regulator
MKSQERAMNKERKILLAEDEENLRFSLANILEDAGWEVAEASDGEEARKILEKDGGKDIDMLALDIQMPKMNGLELLDWLDSKDIRKPTLIMTGFGSRQLLLEIIKRGCDEYIDKPFTPGEFMAAVDRAWKKQPADPDGTLVGEAPAEYSADTESAAVADFRGRLGELKNKIRKNPGDFNSHVDLNQDENGVRTAFRIRRISDLGGDFFGLQSTAAGCEAIVADVSGHDLPASWHAAVVRSLFEENRRAGYDGKTFMRILNGLLCGDGGNERMVTAVFARINLRGRQVRVVSAGHPHMIRMVSGDGAPVLFTGSDFPLGMRRNVEFHEVVFPFSPMDRLVFFTDGLTGASRTSWKTGRKIKLGRETLSRLLMKNAGLPLDSMIEAVWERALGFCRNKPSDDMLLAGIELP